MKALVYHGPGQKAWQDVPDPDDHRPDRCDRGGGHHHDLRHRPAHPQGGRAGGDRRPDPRTRGCRDDHRGRLGGAARLAVGDRVIISCITSCGVVCLLPASSCPRIAWPTRAPPGIGWILGHLIDGTQAEYVRVPFAESSLHRLPDGVSDEAAVMLSDILPTGFEIGVRNGRVKPGDVVAVVGAGPVGLAAMMTAGLYGASRIIAIDLDDNRVEQAKDFGATDASTAALPGWKDRGAGHDRRGLGVDVAIEAVGVPVTFEMATELIRPGGTVANVGVHGTSVELKLQDLWIKDVAITTGLVSATTTPMLLKLVAQGKLAPEKFASHRFTFDSIIDAYDTFGRAAETKALKVVINR